MKADQLGFPFLPKLQGGKITEISLELPEKLTFEQWEEIGQGLGKIEQSTQWWIGDWWAFGEHRYGARKELVESEGWTGPSFVTCTQAARVAKDFESCRRLQVLSFWYHHEVAGLPPEEADRLLKWCQEPVNNGAKQPRTQRSERE